MTEEYTGREISSDTVNSDSVNSDTTKEDLTVQDLITQGDFRVVNLGNGADRPITTPFCCDLLSIAMSRAPEGCAWVTVMGNINTLAVAALTDAACIILAEGVSLDEAAACKAKEQEITVLKTELSVFDGALAVYRLMHKNLLHKKAQGTLHE